jgi:hypothetical protein
VGAAPDEHPDLISLLAADADEAWKDRDGQIIMGLTLAANTDDGVRSGCSRRKHKARGSGQCAQTQSRLGRRATPLRRIWLSLRKCRRWQPCSVAKDAA